MEMSTLEKAIGIKNNIERIDGEMKKWEKCGKLSLAYSDWEVMRNFNGHLIPDEIYNSFKIEILNHLKARKLELMEELGEL